MTGDRYLTQPEAPRLQSQLVNIHLRFALAPLTAADGQTRRAAATRASATTTPGTPRSTTLTPVPDAPPWARTGERRTGGRRRDSPVAQLATAE